MHRLYVHANDDVVFVKCFVILYIRITQKLDKFQNSYRAIMSKAQPTPKGKKRFAEPDAAEAIQCESLDFQGID